MGLVLLEESKIERGPIKEYFIHINDSYPKLKY